MAGMLDIDAHKLEQALDRAGDGVCAVSSDGRVVLWNRAAERILGHPARDVVGRSCCDVFAGRDDHGNPVCHPGCRIMTLAGLPEPLQHFDMLTRTKGGRTVWLDVSVLALPRASWMLGNGRGNGDVLLHVFRDVTESKELLAVLRERFTPPLPADSSPVDGATALTRREIEVLRLVAQGARTKAVAERLRLSPATVRNHVHNILGKLGAHNRLEPVAYATRHRLL